MVVVGFFGINMRMNESRKMLSGFKRKLYILTEQKDKAYNLLHNDRKCDEKFGQATVQIVQSFL